MSRCKGHAAWWRTVRIGLGKGNVSWLGKGERTLAYGRMESLEPSENLVQSGREKEENPLHDHVMHAK